MSAVPFTLHIRMTKQCNADCSYCSSYETVSTGRMRPESFAQAIQFIFDVAMPRLGAAPSHITAQYIGGEILTYPFGELQSCVRSLRAEAGNRGVQFMDGCQSNLIGSPAKVDRLYRLFDGRLGTSVDSFSDSRTVKGSADSYRLIWRESDDFLRRRRSPPGAVYVLDKTGLQNAPRQVREAMMHNRAITLRPVFQGGTPGQQLLGAAETRDSLATVFSQWFMRMPTIVEPFFHMTTQRLATSAGRAHGSISACAFQFDCSRKSLSLEPNGDLYICQEMADAGLYRIGNALTGEWNSEVVRAVEGRAEHLSDDCKGCTYLADCQGGCLFESLQQGSGLYGKSHHCTSWKTLFALIDEGIALHGPANVRGWLKRIESRYANALNDGMAMAALEALEEHENA